ncbi:MAG TPA: PLP-dependent transferase, partial [Nocardioides sp.]|nr:PLP-dependent transferase [Nocardioides sp.]
MAADTTSGSPPRPGTLALATLAVTAGRPDKVPDAPLNTPITMAATYVAGGDVEYGRYGNPTWTALEDALGALEGGRCLAFASGLAAVATVLDL